MQADDLAVQLGPVLLHVHVVVVLVLVVRRPVRPAPHRALQIYTLLAKGDKGDMSKKKGDETGYKIVGVL